MKNCKVENKFVYKAKYADREADVNVLLFGYKDIKEAFDDLIIDNVKNEAVMLLKAEELPSEGFSSKQEGDSSMPRNMDEVSWDSGKWTRQVMPETFNMLDQLRPGHRGRFLRELVEAVATVVNRHAREEDEETV